MIEPGMVVRIPSDIAAEIRSLSREHNYEPEEIVQHGIGFIPMLLREKTAGHKFFVVDAEGKPVKEWVMTQPKSVIDAEAKKIIESAFPAVSPRESTTNPNPDKWKRRKEPGPSPDGQAR